MGNRRKKLLLAVLTCLALGFIWGNSLLSGEESGALSSGLLSWLVRCFPFFKWLPEYLLRKFGHFSEFCLLGFLSAWLFLLQGQRGVHRATMPLLLSVLAAVTDETIQSFSPDRCPSVMDVWIDVGGACAGIAALFACRLVSRLIRGRRAAGGNR